MKTTKLLSLLCVLLCILAVAVSCTEAPGANGTGTTNNTQQTTATPTQQPTEAPTTDPNGENDPPAPQKKVFTVVVKDTDGNAVKGASVQYCNKVTEVCGTPLTSDADGKVKIELEETDSIDNYYVTINRFAKGTYGNTQFKYYFEANADTLTITLTAYTFKALKGGEGLKDVEISLKSGEDKIALVVAGKVKTDDNGEVKFLLPAGDYTVVVDKAPDGSTLSGDASVAFDANKKAEAAFQ